MGRTLGWRCGRNMSRSAHVVDGDRVYGAWDTGGRRCWTTPQRPTHSPTLSTLTDRRWASRLLAPYPRPSRHCSIPHRQHVAFGARLAELMVGCGYLGADEVSRIPTVKSARAGIVYGPLRDFPVRG